MDSEELSVSMEKYYGERIVTALIGIETDMDMVETVGEKFSTMKHVEDVFVVTGDYDIMLKVRFPDYNEFQDFLVKELVNVEGVKKSKTMMVLSIKKEMGRRIGA
ncbi:MAG: Lrp/AsnC ligand binding domain-containing protein [Candidatus Thermoplasmatota archaeon]|jgi:DNA-binding Lrp family transcriptional regulator|nr:Lrp/AsnC ligand binding domain-containing protein [Candidatus Thermoplasmatota archaeon]